MKREEGAEDDGTKLGVKWEARNASGVGAGATLEMINVHERGLFLDGVKLVAVISEAASAGISLHADKCVPNSRFSSTTFHVICVVAAVRALCHVLAVHGTRQVD